MKKNVGCLISVFTIFILSCFSFKNPNDCSKIKTGRFYYYRKALLRSKVNIERTDTTQIETNPISGLVLRSRIAWKSSCSYDMFVNSLSQTRLNASDSLLSVTPVTIDIVYLSDDFYIYNAKMIISNKLYELKDTIFIVH